MSFNRVRVSSSPFLCLRSFVFSATESKNVSWNRRWHEKLFEQNVWNEHNEFSRMFRLWTVKRILMVLCFGVTENCGVNLIFYGPIAFTIHEPAIGRGLLILFRVAHSTSSSYFIERRSHYNFNLKRLPAVDLSLNIKGYKLVFCMYRY